jgi:sarcosine oxidase
VSSWDVIVIGCGGIGSAALRHLAARGASVLGLDRFPVGHDRGSSHGETRVIRQAYFEHPDYVPLLRRAYDLWDELEAESEEKLFHKTGVLQIGPPDGEVVRGVLTSARTHGLSVEELTAADAASAFPGFTLPDGAAAVLERNAGYLRVEACVRAHVERALGDGAQLRIGDAVTGWQAEAGSVTVTTEAETHRAGALVITAGAWSGTLIRDLGVPLTVLRKHLHWYGNRDERYLEANGCPVFFYEIGGRLFYGFPQRDTLGVKVSEHSGGEVTALPDTLSRDPDPVDVESIEGFLRKHLPGVEPRRTRHDVCMYTMTPDAHFLVDVHPAHENVCFAAGLSGHGFKFASALGEALSELALGNGEAAPEFLGLQRFG